MGTHVQNFIKFFEIMNTPSVGFRRRRMSGPNGEPRSNGVLSGFSPSYLCTFSLRICGPKFSACLALMSLWGIIQLGLLSVAFHSRALALVEDLKLNDSLKGYDDKFDDMERGYDLAANNCWIAALLYIVTFVISAHQYW